MRIAVSGASGFLGTALTARLEPDHEVVRLTLRPPTSPLERRWDPAAGYVESLGLSDIDAVINLAGPGIAAKRWTASRRRELLTARVQATRTLAQLIAAEERPTAFLSASAVGFYGSTGDRVIDERDPGGTSYIAALCQQWEEAAAGAGVRTVLLRTGLPLDRAGGFLGTQLPLYRLGLGGRMGDGLHWLPWIALEDWVNAVVHLLTTQISGPVNLSAPRPVPQAVFARELGRCLDRPAKMPTPLLPLRAVLGNQLVDEMLLASNRMVPAALVASGFQFTHPTLEGALAAALR